MVLALTHRKERETYRIRELRENGGGGIEKERQKERTYKRKKEKQKEMKKGRKEEKYRSKRKG